MHRDREEKMREQYSMTEIRSLFEQPQEYAGKDVTVGGWIRSNRDSKAVGFIVLSDGSCFQTLQLVYAAELEDFSRIAKLGVGAAIIATGTIVLTPNAKQPFEMQVKSVELEGDTTPDYPMQKKRHTFE